MDEKLSAKAKFLYERNNNSPLFLRAADFYLSNNDAQNALTILEKGLKIFPDHPLAFILIGKAHLKLGNIDSVDPYIKRASEILNSNRTYSYYKNELNLPDKPVSPFDSSRGNIFINSSIDEDDTLKIKEELVDKPESIDNRLAQLDQAMMNARIEKKDDFFIPETDQRQHLPDKSKLASETLAKIYLSQGEKNEAIKIYELLIHRNPEKKEHYLEKIREILSQ